MELILQKATELGASVIVPVITDHVVPDSSKINMERLYKICREAAIQSSRYTIPTLSHPVPLTKIVTAPGKLFCLAERQSTQTLKKFLDSQSLTGPSIGVIVGAEGGFSDKELQFMSEHNIPLVSFGNSILRTETASIATLSVLRLYFSSDV